MPSHCENLNMTEIYEVASSRPLDDPPPSPHSRRTTKFWMVFWVFNYTYMNINMYINIFHKNEII